MKQGDGIREFVDWLIHPPQGGKSQLWPIGVLLAAIVFAYGLSCILTQSATVPQLLRRRHGLITTLDGTHAIAYGVFFVCVAYFIHFQWFWGNHPTLVKYYFLPKYIALTASTCALAYHIYALFMID